MDYSLMGDDEILKDLAEQIEKLRIGRRIKDTDLEEASGVSRKTLYNFRQGKTGLSLKNFIRILKALDEVGRLQRMFPESDSYSPRGNAAAEQPKRVRDRQHSGSDFKWGDES